jgi:hypothetical protein
MRVYALLAVILSVALLLGCQPAEWKTVHLCQKADACAGPPPSGDWACDIAGKDALFGYDPSGPTFIFQAVGSVPNPLTEYVVVYYPDPWPGEGLICLSDPVTSGEDGSITVEGNIAIYTDLPISTDANLTDGAKIWLVPKDMVDCANHKMANWNDCPGILFEQDINYRVFYTYVPNP